MLQKMVQVLVIMNMARRSPLGEQRASKQDRPFYLHSCCKLSSTRTHLHMLVDFLSLENMHVCRLSSFMRVCACMHTFVHTRTYMCAHTCTHTLHLHLPLNHKGRSDATDYFTTSFLLFFFLLFSTALWDLANSRPVQSLMYLPTSSSICLVFWPLSLCLAG